MSTTRSPFVYWGQDKTRIFFRVDIKEAKDVIAQIKDEDTKKIEFYASDFTDQKYHFDLNLANNIKKFIEVNVKESKVELVLTKAEESDWNALIEKTANNSRTPLWLKIDFDRWKPDDSTEDEAEKSNPSNDLYQNLCKQMNLEDNKASTNRKSTLKKLDYFNKSYLFSYNSCMFMAHFYVLSSLLSGYFSSNSNYLKTFWQPIFPSLIACTLLQYLDVLHGFIGFTKSNWKTVIMQVSGRLAIIFIINGNSEIHSWFSVYILMVAYLMGEQSRYPYYALRSVNINLAPISSLRYNQFLIFYPIGFLMETFVLFASIPFYLNNETYSLKLPNSLNFSYNFGVVLAFSTVTVFPYIAFKLFGHMRQQRAKKMKKKN